MPSEDITFCGVDCPNKKCERNRKNIKQYWLDHSFAYFTDCPIYKKLISEDKQDGSAS